MKNFKKIIAILLVISFLIMSFSSVAVFAEGISEEATSETVEEINETPVLIAEGNGWVEISVTVPQYFTDQIYVQLQNVNNIVEGSEDNYVQINRYNDYIGRIQLPSGTYEITDMYAYEHPDLYDIQIAEDSVLPIRVTASSTATAIKLVCTEISEENVQPEQPEMPVDSAVVTESEPSEDVSDNTETINSEENTSSEGENGPESDSTEQPEEDKPAEEKPQKSALYRLVVSFIKNLIWFFVLGGIGYICYRKFYLNH